MTKIKVETPNHDNTEQKANAAGGCALTIFGLAFLAVIVYSIYVICSL